MASSMIETLTTDFSQENAERWLRKTFASFAGDGLQLNVKHAPFDRAGVKEAKRLGYVVLARATDASYEVEVPVFLVRMARMGMGPQRKAQFACAKQIMKGWGSPRGERDVPGALFFFHAEGRTRLSLVTPRDQAATDYKRQSFLLVPEEKGRVRNQTFCKYFDGSRVTCFGRPGEKVHGARSLLARFSVEALTKEFYTELFAWYEWAAEKAGVSFPNAVGDLAKTKEHLIRLITRLMFVWFVRERGLVPDELFDAKWLGEHFLRDFDPKDDKDGTYYNAVLQNLFFATLNQPVQERRFAAERSYHGKNASYGVNTLFRDKYMRVEEGTWFRLSHDEVLKLFASVPYLNGGLFECLDPEDKKTAENCRDGFSRCAKNRAVLPNRIFFGDGKREGLLTLLKRYDFTIDENHATDADIALDPELLGKVFENLLASYNPETGVSARKASGSFYTPREIVDYMVDQSLRAALASVADVATLDVLFGEDAEAIVQLPTATKAKMCERLKELKTIDPACGSGAFPMGLLNRLVALLGDLGDEEDVYHRKLHLMENGIYGGDIQPIAAQISKLRFFISLLCDQTPDPSKPNAGLDQLPNLETHLVIANSLVWFQEDGVCLLSGTARNASKEKRRILELREQLVEIRREHVRVHSRPKKLELRKKDEEICKELRNLLKTLGFGNTEMLAEWNPYDPGKHAPFFDPEWMFGFSTFDIVIGNPPYGIPLSKEEKAYVKAHYQSAKTIKGVQKGSMDSYSLFIERGFRLLHKGGTLVYIVPISITSSDSATGIHNLLKANCAEIRVSSYAVRPFPVFENATVNTSILSFTRTNAPCEHLYSTKMYRKDWNNSIGDILSSLSFVDVKSLCLYGRIPKIGTEIEQRILVKLSQRTSLGAEVAKLKKDDEVSPVFYRTTGGRYFKVVTPYSTGSTKEKGLLVRKDLQFAIGACLSSSLSFWFYQIYSNNLDWKSSELLSFPIPDFSESQLSALKTLYEDYLDSIEANSRTLVSSGTSRYLVKTFKVYQIAPSKPL